MRRQEHRFTMVRASYSKRITLGPYYCHSQDSRTHLYEQRTEYWMLCKKGAEPGFPTFSVSYADFVTWFSLHDKNATNIIVTGHSLGAAIGVMDSIFLRNSIDHSIPIRTTVFGLPRSGDQAWAYVHCANCVHLPFLYQLTLYIAIMSTARCVWHLSW